MTRRNAVGDFIIGTGMLFREGLLLKFPLMSKKLVNKKIRQRAIKHCSVNNNPPLFSR